jgi:hypothetical protein
MSSSMINGQYEVLSPWAQADPIPLRGLKAPRLTNLEGKKIGLYCNVKRAAPLIMTVVERKLKERFPTSQFSWYQAGMYGKVNEATKAKLEKWIDGVDTVILAVGD